MKKIIFSFFMFGISATGFSQKYELGAKAGLNISNFIGSSNSADLRAKSIVGFHGGGFLSLFFGKTFALQPEILFSTQGASVDSATIIKKSYKVNYINIPLMLKLRFASGLYIEAGPQVGFKVTEKVSGTSEDFAKNSDLSIAAGLGLHTSLGLAVGVRYVSGLSKVGDFNTTNITANKSPDWKNGVIQASVYFTLVK